MNTQTNTLDLVGRRLYRISDTGFAYDECTGKKVMTKGPADFHTIKGVLPDRRVIAERNGRMVVLVIGNEWHLEESTG